MINWTESQICEVLRLYFEGLPRKEIAKRLNRTDRAIQSILRREKNKRYSVAHNGQKQKVLTKRQQQFIRLFSEPHTHEKIAQLMGIQIETSRREKWRLQKMGYSFPRSGHQIKNAKKNQKKLCDCGNRIKAKNLCSKCYSKALVKGEIKARRKVPQAINGTNAQENHGWKNSKRTIRKRICLDDKSGDRIYEPDQEEFILTIQRLREKLQRIPTELEAFREAIRIGYRLVEKATEIPFIRKVIK